MTCHDARDRFSALLDDALAVPARQALDAHLAACTECRRELEQFRATVALLGHLPPARAPAGFVDRVMAGAYPPPWPRRLLDALFVPLRVKLPLEAAAVLLVGVSALYVYQHAPEVQQLARRETGGSSSAPTVAPAAPPSGAASTPPAAGVAGPVGGSASGEPAAAPAPSPPGHGQAGVAGKLRPKDGARGAERGPVEQGAAREEARQAQPAPPAALAPPESAARGDDARKAPAAKAAPKKEAQAERRLYAPDAATSPAQSRKAAQSPEPSPSRDAAGAPSPATPSTAGTGAPPAAPPLPAPEARGGVGGGTPAPAAAPTPGSAPSEALSSAKSRVAARLLRAVDARGRLAVAAREPAEAALDALLGRLGATRVERRLESDPGMLVIEVLVPDARYRELVEGLGRIGRWVADHEPGTLPTQVRVEVVLTIEP